MEDVIDQLIRMLEGLRKTRDAVHKRRVEAEAKLARVEHCLEFYVETKGTVSLRDVLKEIIRAK